MTANSCCYLTKFLQKTKSPGWLTQQRILIIENQRDIAKSYQTILQERFSFSNFYLAENGSQAIEQMQDQTFDLIISGWKMPGLSEGPLLEKIRSLKNGKTVPILIISSWLTKSTIAAALALNISNFIVKPAAESHLVNKIKKLLLNAAPPNHFQLALRLDLANSYLSRFKPEKALEQIRVAQRLDANNAAVATELGKYNFLVGKYPEGIKLLKNPSDPQKLGTYLNQVGVNYIEQGYFKQALAFYKQALAVLTNPHNQAVIYYNIGLAHKKQTQNLAALYYFKLAYDNNPAEPQFKSSLQSVYKKPEFQFAESCFEDWLLSLDSHLKKQLKQ